AELGAVAESLVAGAPVASSAPAAQA
ncbi:MAG: hypothetical protein QOD55_2227, partial [Solirubrobacteraceae bacterium]|nr:hypothetical protein [Solirubrobacteraceae bacterium]